MNSLTRTAAAVALAGAVLASSAAAQGGLITTHEAELTPLNDGQPGGFFGSGVAVSGDTAVVGATRQNFYGVPGAAYVYVRTGTIWERQAILAPDYVDDHNSFGRWVAIEGDTIAVGSYGDDLFRGAVYVFTRSGTEWSQQARLTNPDAEPFDSFGQVISMSGDTLAVSAHGENDQGDYTGAAYVFVRSGTTWSRQARLTALDAAAGQSFGLVALEGDLLVVGATSDDELGDGAGAAYVFTRQGTTWSQQQKLTAFDASPSDHFGFPAVSGDTILIGSRLDSEPWPGMYAHGSAYVFVHDGTSWNHQQKLTASDPAERDELGWSVTLDGDTALVTAHRGELDGHVDTGSIYVFVRDGTTWSEQLELAPDDADENDWFGSSKALAGDLLLVGAAGTDEWNHESGSAYVFVRNGTAWTEQQKLTPGESERRDLFGSSVGVSGDVAIAGVPDDDHAGGADAGSAYVFERSGPVWDLTARLRAQDAAPGTALGRSVSIDGDSAVIGAPADDHAGSNAGSAYVFVKNGTTWSQQDKLTAFDATAGDAFGWSVAISGDTALVGAVFDDHGGGADAGAAYVFTRSGTVWSFQEKLTALDAAGTDLFGISVSIDGDSAIVGAYFDDEGGFANAGAAYVFTRSAGVWSQQARLVAPDPASNDWFGTSVSIRGDDAVVGSYQDDDAGSASGSAYAFARSGGTWGPPTKCTASDAAGGDRFGATVALSGDLLLIGAPDDDEVEDDSGSVYVYSRGGGTWDELTKLTAPTPGRDDGFGTSVALADGTAVVGAPRDDHGEIEDAGSAHAFGLSFEAVPFCFGTVERCPCDNAGLADTGCDNAQGTGGVKLEAVNFAPDGAGGGSIDVLGTGYDADATPTVILMRSDRTWGPVWMGDGLLCLWAPVDRIGTTVATAGLSGHHVDHGVGAGTFYYQCLYRNNPAGYCEPDPFNLSSGLIIAWP